MAERLAPARRLIDMSLISCVVRRGSGSRCMKAAMGTTRWAAVALCFALAGCGGQAPAGAGAATPATTAPAITAPATTVPVTTAPVTTAGPTGRTDATTTPQRSATPVAYLVEYGRQGGLAGVDDRLVVQPDGSFTISHRGGAVSRGRLSPADLTKLRQVLEASHFGQVPTVTASGAVVDAFTYHVVYAEHEVTAADGEVPAALRPVLAEFEELLQRYGGQ
jgi:hypothetical protein